MVRTDKKDELDDYRVDALEDNRLGWTDPGLWEDVKKRYGPVTLQNMHKMWLVYWEELGKKGSRRFGFFDYDAGRCKQELLEERSWKDLHGYP